MHIKFGFMRSSFICKFLMELWDPHRSARSIWIWRDPCRSMINPHGSKRDPLESARDPLGSAIDPIWTTRSTRDPCGSVVNPGKYARNLYRSEISLCWSVGDPCVSARYPYRSLRDSHGSSRDKYISIATKSHLQTHAQKAQTHTNLFKIVTPYVKSNLNCLIQILFFTLFDM